MSEARLHVTDSQGQRVVVLDRPLFMIGRRTSADLQIVSTHVSREHAEIALEDGRYLLRDRGSRYGTFVNGEQITERTLQHGDRIRLGQTEAIELFFMTETESATSDVARVLVEVRRHLDDEEYFRAIADALQTDSVHCQDIDSLELQRQLRDPRSEAYRSLTRHFYRVIEFDAREGRDDNDVFVITKFLGHIAKQMSDSFGLNLLSDMFHPEEVFQVLKDEQASLFCFLNVDVIPRDQLRALRGFTQEHHRSLFCGPHTLDGVRSAKLSRTVDGELGVLLEHSIPPLVQWARQRLPQWARGFIGAEDVVQNVVLRVLPRLQSFEARHPSALQTYLRDAVSNYINDALRERTSAFVAVRGKAAQARLHVTDSQGWRVVVLDRPLFMIGGRTSADLQIVSTDVAREHAEIALEDGRYLLRDRSSRYGTFVNGEQITERTLQHGDRIQLGRTEAIELVFMTESAT
jgi:pSer/pThr/pTyr-binding forkhead associated (FHA) protein